MHSYHYYTIQSGKRQAKQEKVTAREEILQKPDKAGLFFFRSGCYNCCIMEKLFARRQARMKRRFPALLALLLCLLLAGCARGAKKPAQGTVSLPVGDPAELTQSTPPADTAPEIVTLPTGDPAEPARPPETGGIPTLDPDPAPTLAEDGSYDSKEDVALYLHLYGHLPPNYITKKQAEALGWPGGSLEPYAPGKCIGGSRFGNYEELLPVKKGRTYTECDIGTLGAKSRGAKRIVFSNDGLIYYTEDHYESFELLYGEE